MIGSCSGIDLNVQHATDYMRTYLMYLWAKNVIVIIDSPLIVGTEGVSWAHYHANLKSSLHPND